MNVHTCRVHNVTGRIGRRDEILFLLMKLFRNAVLVEYGPKAVDGGGHSGESVDAVGREAMRFNVSTTGGEYKRQIMARVGQVLAQVTPKDALLQYARTPQLVSSLVVTSKGPKQRSDESVLTHH